MKIGELIDNLAEWQQYLGDVEVTLGQYNEEEGHEWEAHISQLGEKEIDGLKVLSIY